MKRRILVLSIGSVFISSLVFFQSCKKINESTELGNDLVPAVDNVHTFEVALDAVTNNVLFNDTTRVSLSDLVVVGDIDDPEFGHTHANVDFTITPGKLGAYPFVKTDSLNIDSVVLSLSYQGAYGDTVTNGVQTFRVFEIDQNSGFADSISALYNFSDPATDFATVGPELGSATFTIQRLKDTITLARAGDTTQVSNVVRIRLDNALALRFAQYDTTNTSNGGFRTDSIFRKLFRGLSVKADASGNALTYFNLTDYANTKLTVYFRYGVADTSSFDFYHDSNGQANYINRQNGGNFLAYLNNGASDKIYLQSAPGSYASIKIPALDTFGNKIIHRAELFAEKIPSAGDDIFTVPSRLILDRKNRVAPDTVFMLENDLVADASGGIGFGAFGGTLLSDNTYRFNISRYVQSIVTKHVANDTLRLYAPLRTILFNKSFNTPLSLPIISAIAKGRVVLGGGSYADPAMKLRLRIIYSNL